MRDRPTDLLTRLLSLCRCGVFVTVNEHRDYYQDVATFLADRGVEEREIDADVQAEMIARDTCVQVQAYPHTPIGFYLVYHWDLGTALQQLLDTLTLETPHA